MNAWFFSPPRSTIPQGWNRIGYEGQRVTGRVKRRRDKEKWRKREREASDGSRGMDDFFSFFPPLFGVDRASPTSGDTTITRMATPTTTSTTTATTTTMTTTSRVVFKLIKKLPPPHETRRCIKRRWARRFNPCHLASGHPRDEQGKKSYRESSLFCFLFFFPFNLKKRERERVERGIGIRNLLTLILVIRFWITCRSFFAGLWFTCVIVKGGEI